MNLNNSLHLAKSDARCEYNNFNNSDKIQNILAFLQNYADLNRGFIEIRYIYDDIGLKKINFSEDKSNFISINPHNPSFSTLKTLDKWLDDNKKYKSLYFSTSQRKSTDKFKQKAQYSYQRRAVIFDFDFEEFRKENLSYDEIFTKYCEIRSKFNVTPHLVNFSGAGFHFYFFTNHDLTKQQLQENIAYAELLGADNIIYDNARVLRLPYTINCKSKNKSNKESIILEENYNLDRYNFYDVIDKEKIKDRIFIHKKVKKSADNVAERLNKSTKCYNFEDQIISASIYKQLMLAQKYVENKLRNKDDPLKLTHILKFFNIDYKFKGTVDTGSKYELYSYIVEDGRNPDMILFENSTNNQTKHMMIYDPHVKYTDPLFISLFKYKRAKFIDFSKKVGIYGYFADKISHVNVLDQFNEFKIKPDRTLYIDDYITTEIAEKIFTNESNILIDARTGSGKTSTLLKYALNNNLKVIWAVPYSSQVMQLKKDYNIFGLCSDSADKFEQFIESTQTVICMTYDQIANISKYDDFILVVDEAHNIINQVDFRKRAISKMVFSLDNFSKFVWLSGTAEGLQYIKQRKKIEIWKILQNNRKLKSEHYYIHNCSSTPLEHAINHISQNAENKKILVLCNSHHKLQYIQDCLKSNSNLQSTVISANTKHETVFKNIIENSTLSDKKDGIFLSTSVIADGVNLLDQIDEIILIEIFDLTLLRQFIARPRGSVNEIHHFIKDIQKLGSIVSYNRYREVILEDMKEYIKEVNKLKHEKLSYSSYLYVKSNEKYLRSELKNDITKYHINDCKILFDYQQTLFAHLYHADYIKQIISDLENIQVSIIDHKSLKEQDIDNNKLDRKQIIDLLKKYKSYDIKNILETNNPIAYANKNNISISDIQNIKQFRDEAKEYLIYNDMIENNAVYLSNNYDIEISENQSQNWQSLKATYELKECAYISCEIPYQKNEIKHDLEREKNKIASILMENDFKEMWKTWRLIDILKNIDSSCDDRATFNAMILKDILKYIADKKKFYLNNLVNKINKTYSINISNDDMLELLKIMSKYRSKKNKFVEIYSIELRNDLHKYVDL